MYRLEETTKLAETSDAPATNNNQGPTSRVGNRDTPSASQRRQTSPSSRGYPLRGAVVAGGFCTSTGKAGEDRQRRLPHNPVVHQDVQIGSTTRRYPTRQHRVSETKGHSTWQMRLRAREDVNYKEVDEFEDEGWSADEESQRPSRSSSCSSKSHRCAGRTQTMTPKAKRTSTREHSTTEGRKRFSNGINLIPEGNNSLLRGSGQGVQQRPPSTSTGINRGVRQETHASVESATCSSAANHPGIHEILRKLHQLEEDTTAPKTTKPRHHSSTYIAVPPWVLKLENRKAGEEEEEEEEQGHKEQKGAREEKSYLSAGNNAEKSSDANAVSALVQAPIAGLSLPSGQAPAQGFDALDDTKSDGCISTYERNRPIHTYDDRRTSAPALSVSTSKKGTTWSISSGTYDNAGRRPKRKVTSDAPDRFCNPTITPMSLEASLTWRTEHRSPSGAKHAEVQTRSHGDVGITFGKSSSDQDTFDDIGNVFGLMPEVVVKSSHLHEYDAPQHEANAVGPARSKPESLEEPRSTWRDCPSEASLEGATGRAKEELAEADTTSEELEERGSGADSGVSGWMKFDGGRKIRSLKTRRARGLVLHHKLVSLNTPPPLPKT